MIKSIQIVTDYHYESEGMRMTQEISKFVLRRLPIYLAYMKTLSDDDYMYISATSIAIALNMGEVQVRKDLALVSNNGKPKVGYHRKSLIEELEHFLGYDYTDNAVLVGAGKLGQALMAYSGFREYGLDILAAFDVDPSLDKTDCGKPVFPMEQLPEYIRANKIRIGIITVPEEQAQNVCDLLVDCGVRAIWNFAPVRLEVPKRILLQNENLASSLAVISMHMQALWKDKDNV